MSLSLFARRTLPTNMDPGDVDREDPSTGPANTLGALRAQQAQAESVATEPLRRVGTEKELNPETQLDKDYVENKEMGFEEAEEVEDSEKRYSSGSSLDPEKKIPPETKRPAFFSRSQTNATTSTRGSSLSRISPPDRVPKKHSWFRWLEFKSRTEIPVPKERRISKEYTANVFSLATFSWMSSIMRVGYNRPLELNDIWLVNPNRSADYLSNKVEESFKRRTARGDKRPLLGALHEALKFEFYLGGASQLMASVVQVVNPFVLRYLISFAAEAYIAQTPTHPIPPPPIGRGVGLVIAITILQTIQNACSNQFMYRGMVNGGQARSVLISLIFDKALRISGRAKAGGRALETVDEQKPLDIQPGSEEEKSWFKKKLSKGRKGGKAPDAKGQKGVLGDGHGYGNGRIINLMSVDSYRVDQASGMFHVTWTSPIAIIITLILLLVNIKASALAGFGFVVLSMPLLGKAIRSLLNRRKTINKLTDQRVSLTQEVLSAVRFVKYFGWETSFLERIGNIRSQEIRAIQYLLSIRNGINAISMSMPIFAAMLAFIAYAYTHPNFNPALIFSSLALFNSLRLPLNMLPLVIGQVTDAVNSIKRIEDFLMAEDAEDGAEWDSSCPNAIEMRNGSFTWERSPTKDSNDTVDASKNAKQKKEEEKAVKKANRESKRLSKGSDSEKSKPQETGVAGDDEKIFTISDLDFSVARNELVAVIGGVGSGKSSLLAALAGDMRKTSGSVTMGSSRAFCPQYAWIQNATLKENILFGKDLDIKWYNQVIDACALRADLEMLPGADLTEIGERGITVSGGQKQRLNIARAIYFDSDIILMDDPLSAVDAHVGRHIMDQAICGLLRNKCRVLATHQLWVLQRCDRVIWMDEGRIGAIDTFDNLMASNPEFVKLIANNAQEEKQDETEHVDEDEVEDEKKTQEKRKGKKPSGSLMQAEERAVSSVSWSVYYAYIKSSGSILVLPLILILLIASQGASIVTNLWLSWWTSNKFGFSRGTYVGGYAALGFVQALLMFIFSVALSVFGTTSSKVMLHRAITRVLRAPMSFFDTTPQGRITNRFSKDIDTMDNMLTDSIRFFGITMGLIISVFILIIAYYYFFAVALGPLFLLFLFSASYYRASAREIKRHESVLRSVVFARFSEAVTGVATIRAYGLQSRFQRSIRAAVDDMDSAYYLTFANQRWLSVRLDIIGNLLVFTVGILVVTSRFSVNPSTGGLVLSYILSIVQMIQFTVRQLAEVENNMNSTERIHHYGTQLEEEPPLHLPNPDVVDSWPQSGAINFENVQMRYRDGLPLVLKGLNLRVAGGERVGVVGRTGAGKSSIMSTLFRLVELSGGRITIDGVDIARVGLNDLRARLSIIPQDPTLFRGTVRSNLDPFGKYTDHELWNALRAADLVDASRAADDKPTGRITLDSSVDEEGLNFSLGQRQLMALARALVRGSQIIVCDEATSSVDMETDERIQATMARGFKGKTMLCIAHRLKTIIHYDRIVVMDNGVIAECDEPLRLWRQGGIFRSMCDRSAIKMEDFEKRED